MRLLCRLSASGVRWWRHEWVPGKWKWNVAEGGWDLISYDSNNPRRDWEDERRAWLRRCCEGKG